MEEEQVQEIVEAKEEEVKSSPISQKENVEPVAVVNMIIEESTSELQKQFLEEQGGDKKMMQECSSIETDFTSA